MLFKRYPDPLTHFAAIRLVVAVVVFIVFGSGIIWTAIAYYERRHLMEQAVEYTSSSSSLIRKSVIYQMLHRNPQAIQSTIENLVDGDNIKIISIFDGKGRVAYSSKPKESEAGPGVYAKTCSGCHNDRGRSPRTLSDKRDWRIEEEGKSRTLIFSEPIYNEPSCSSAGCHFHQPSQPVLGTVETVFSLVRIHKQMDKTILNKALFPLVSFWLASFAGGFLFWRFFYRRSSVYSKDAAKNVAGGPTGSSVRQGTGKSWVFRPMSIPGGPVRYPGRPVHVMSLKGRLKIVVMMKKTSLAWPLTAYVTPL